MKSSRTVGVNFETEQSAKTIFEFSLPGGWLAREQSPDFHIDYVVEVVESGELTGQNFGAQLKGTQPKKGKPLRLVYRLKKKHLRYYLKCSVIPVFLILLDVVNRRSYWCFTQKFAREHMAPGQLEGKGTVPIRFAAEDCMGDIGRFRQAVHDAIEYQKELHPGSVKAAVEAQKAKYREIDPRLDVTISLDGGHQHISMAANQPFDFKASFTSDDAPTLNQALKDFIEKGAELKLKPSALKFEGAPLLSHLFTGSDDGHVVLRFDRSIPATLCAFEGHTSPEFLFQVASKFVCGSRYATFEASLPNSALFLKTSFSIEGLIKNEPFDFEISLNPDKWSGQRIGQLAHFEVIRRFVSNLNQQVPTILNFQSDGNDLFKSRFCGLSCDNLAEMLSILDLIYKARFIANKYAFDLALPKLSSIPSVDLNAIEDVYELLHGREVRLPYPNFRSVLRVNEAPPIADRTIKNVFRARVLKKVFQLLGRKIELGPVNHFVTEAALESATLSRDGSTEFVLVGSEKSVLIMRLDESAVIP